MNQELIIVEVGGTRLETRNHQLAQLVLISAAPEETEHLAVAGASDIPAIGTYWHGQGGVYIGQVRGEDGNPDYHLIAPTAPIGQVEAITWGGAGKNETEATALRDGLANTRALCASKHDHPAAQWATDLAIEGHHDWYLPARHELRLCYLNVPELFSTEGWYASSTQYCPYDAWIQDFGGGLQIYDRKDNERRAVAVRRVSAL